jgi:hypothetical protein
MAARKSSRSKTKKANVPRRRRPTTPCTIPEPVDPAVLYAFAPQPKEETDVIKSYVEWQSPNERVTYVEKVLSERIFDRKMDAYDVHTDGERYWVITQPTNLYSQRLFPSLDYTISFHVKRRRQISNRIGLQQPGVGGHRLRRVWMPQMRLKNSKQQACVVVSV